MNTVDRLKAITHHLKIGRISSGKGNHFAALKAFREVIALDPRHVGALGEMALVFNRQGRIQEAIKAVRAALEVSPKNANLHAQLGHLLIKRTNWKDAETIFQMALQIQPTHPGAMGGLASTFMRQGRGEEALVVLEKATLVWPDNAGMHIRYGQVLEEHHRLAAAGEAFQAAATIEPNNPVARAGLLRVRNPALIFEAFEQLLHNKEDDAALTLLARELVISRDELTLLIRFGLYPGQGNAQSIARTPLELQVLLTLALTQERQNVSSGFSYGAAVPVDRMRNAPPATDALAEPESHEGWIPAQWLNAFCLRRTTIIKRAAVVVTMRDEGMYVLEWVAHYRAIGFDTIFIYSNDNIDGSDGLLRELARNGIITYIENQMGAGLSHPQRKAYAHALHLVPELWEHEWVLFVDGDELLVPDLAYKFQISALLDDVAAHYPTRTPSAICFNWFWCISGFTYAYEPRPLLRRFQHGLEKRGMKSMVRLRDIFSMHRVHFPEMDHGGFLARSDFKRLDKALRQKMLEPVFGSARLNHYWNKSFEEFSVKKARGDAAGDRDKLWRRDFELFFEKDAEETEDNYAPVPEALVLAVEDEMQRLKALPGIQDRLTVISDRFPALLKRFDLEGGLRKIFEGGLKAKRGK